MDAPVAILVQEGSRDTVDNVGVASGNLSVSGESGDERTPLFARKPSGTPSGSSVDDGSCTSRRTAGGGMGASFAGHEHGRYITGLSFHAMRNLVGFWIIGMCNNLPGVVLNTAARDILGPSFFNRSAEFLGDQAIVYTPPANLSSTFFLASYPQKPCHGRKARNSVEQVYAEKPASPNCAPFVHDRTSGDKRPEKKSKMNLPEAYSNATTSSMMMPIVSPGRDCNPSTTGVVLLFTIVPGLVAKIIAPFVPVHVRWKVILVILLNAVGIVVIFLSDVRMIVFSGIALTSVAGGLGEVSYLGYTASFQKEVVGSWASGTGGSGLLGSFAYSGFRSLGVSAKISVIVFIVVPALMLLAHFVLLQETPSRVNTDSAELWPEQQYHSHEDQIDSRRRLAVLKLVAVPFMLPLFLVYVAEYFINQGLLELIYFPDAGINHDAQYRWLQVIYQLGVFISRSSTACFTIRYIWLLAILQVTNAAFFSLDAYFWFVPNFFFIVGLVLYEGLLGGWTYVNAFYRLRKEVYPDSEKKFALSVTSLADTTGIAVAGLLAIPVHAFLCGLPVPKSAYFLERESVLRH